MDTRISFRNWLAEGVFDFGKHKGKHHSQVDTGWLAWALQNINDPRFINPEFRREIEEELRNRRGVKRSSTPPPVAKPTPPPAAKPTPPPEHSQTWVLAKISGNNTLGLRMGQDVALSKRADGSWDIISLDAQRKSGVIPGTSVKNMVTSVKDDETGQPITSKDIADLFGMVEPHQQPEPEQSAGPKPNKHILSDEMMDSNVAPGEKSEQRQIDEKFKQIMEGGTQDHIMINALAGTGKTTMLKHLAWKYGNQRQQWLYLVFNTKNKVEAKEKFPPWVQVQTTNGFLGRSIGAAGE